MVESNSQYVDVKDLELYADLAERIRKAAMGFMQGFFLVGTGNNHGEQRLVGVLADGAGTLAVIFDS